MKHSIDEARKLDYGAILFFGIRNIISDSVLSKRKRMAMELIEAYLKNVFGRFIEADIYNDDLNREQAKELILNSELYDKGRVPSSWVFPPQTIEGSSIVASKDSLFDQWTHSETLLRR